MTEKWQQIQGIYVHIPFCMQKCLYCDFASFAGKSGLMHQYALKVCEEIRSRAAEMKVEGRATVYFGGGTPSLLPPEDLKLIIAELRQSKLWLEPAEVTLEANPGTIDANRLSAYRRLGIDRISFGVQSLNDAELKRIGRLHTAQEALAAIASAREAGFARVSADLMYGLPGQTLTSFEQTLKFAIASGVGHLSVYGLTIEEGTPLAAAVSDGSILLPDEEECEAMYDRTICCLEQKGFRRYEISNFAQSGQESLHNIVYWNYLPYMGFGSAACSFDGQRRRTNAEAIEDYLKGSAPSLEEIATRTGFAEAMFLGLRKTDGVDLMEIKRRFGIDACEFLAAESASFIKKGLLRLDGKKRRLSLTERGMKFGNEIFRLFV